MLEQELKDTFCGIHNMIEILEPVEKLQALFVGVGIIAVVLLTAIIF